LVPIMFVITFLFLYTVSVLSGSQAGPGYLAIQVAAAARTFV
jgi:hypothetical protein